MKPILLLGVVDPEALEHWEPACYKSPPFGEWFIRLATQASALYRERLPEHWRSQRAAVDPARHILGTPFSHATLRVGPTDWHRDGNDFGLGVILYFGEFRGYFESDGYEPVPAGPGDMVIYDPVAFHRGTQLSGSRVALILKNKRPFAPAYKDFLPPAPDWKGKSNVT